MKANPLEAWIEEIAQHSSPKEIYVCDGSKEERDRLCSELVQQGTFIHLNDTIRPDSYLTRSNPNDVARTEDRTFICSATPEEAGPTNHWHDPQEMRALLKGLFKNCMQGRTLYVLPFSLGPYDSPLSRLGVQLTDSPYVVCNMWAMARMGQKALTAIQQGQPFVRCLHSVGAPLPPGKSDIPWPCNPTRYITHFPREKEAISFGSGYGGNALLEKKCFALRLASVMGRDEGWLAEHMLIMGLTSPEGEKKYFAAAFPSSCGKTNLAMMSPTLPGWKVETVGDDIAWMKFGKDGQLYAINPEAGLFGVAPGTSMHSNKNAMLALTKEALFTNVALTDQGDVWWEGMTDTPPSHAIDWEGHDWHPGKGILAAHPNARYTVPLSQCPVVDEKWHSPEGVPISGIIFGGRRSSVMPLVLEARNWQHGVFFGASLSSETTAAATGERGKLRHDPFAMLPFCGYNMGDYFSHWLNLGKQSGHRLPKIFYVNWFRKNAAGKYLWPGFSENCRVLKWIFQRTTEQGEAVQSPFGLLPSEKAIDISGLDISSEILRELLHVKPQEWEREISDLKSFFKIFGEKFPQALKDELKHLEAVFKNS